MPETRSTSNAAFSDYGLPNGQILVPATYNGPASQGRGAFEPTPEYVHRLAGVFRTAFVRRAPLPIVPEPVDAAIEDAVAPTVHEFTSVTDLRTAILPRFSHQVAAYTRTYLQRYPDGGVGIDIAE